MGKYRGGSNPVIIYDPGLINQGTEEGLFCVWESFSSPQKIMGSIGRITSEGILWSEPQALTNDAYDDHGLAMAMNTDTHILISWLQQDFSREDDDDLYYQKIPLIDFSSDRLEQVDPNIDEEPPIIPVHPFATGICFGHIISNPQTTLYSFFGRKTRV